MLSLLGAGSLNHSDAVLLPAAEFARSPAAVSERWNNRSEFSPALGLKVRRDWWSDGLVQNDFADLSPGVLPHSSELLRLIRPVQWPQDRADEVSSDIAEARQEDPGLQHLASVEPVGLPREWALSKLRVGGAPLGVNMTLMTAPSFSPPALPPGLHWKRLALVQTGSLGMTIFGFRKFDEFFGGAQRSFRVGSDWSKDHTLHFDELIHFQGGYRITQGLVGMYRWAGLKPAWSEGLGAGTAAAVMTLLEYIDGRRPTKRGASYSDFTANLLGVGFALAKLHVEALQDVDLRLNYTSFGDVLHKKTLLQYDRMTHWLTYDLERQWRVPLHLGVGYGVQNAFKPDVRSEYYLGIGFTPVDILTRYYPAAAKPFAWLSMYHLGWQVQVK